MASRQTRSTAELRAVSNHLFYEIAMLRGSVLGLTSGLIGQGIIGNALLESFTIHARALLDFLYPENPWPDDVIAEDFFPSPSTSWPSG
jgi:hypothetical protein